jgi:hypothetical protein
MREKGILGRHLLGLLLLRFVKGKGNHSMLENKFQANLIKELKDMFPGCIVMKNDASYIQGIPDLLVLYEDKWASLEVKRSSSAKRQPNQDYYVGRMNEMSFSRFICPENKEEVLYELQQTFKS